MSDDVSCGDEVERRKDDLVAWAAAAGKKCHVQSGGPVGHCKCVPGAAELGERLLEGCDPRSHAPPARANGVADGCKKLVVDGDVGERDHPRLRRHQSDASRSCKWKPPTYGGR